MKNRISLLLFITFLFLLVFCNVTAQSKGTKTEETLFVFGGDINLKFVQYVADLTKREKPKICYLPTASADNKENIKYWESICNKLGVESVVLTVWVSSSSANKSFEDILLNSDAIVVGGGNTLNMLGIWKAQGIDTVMLKALSNGIILAGGSAGSICWFQNGISDSRPVSLSLVNGLGYLPYSNCPHYSDEARKELYQTLIKDKKIHSGYACDDLAGILFKNGKAVEFVSQSDKHNSYLVKMEKGNLQAKRMESKILLKKGALSENDYTSISVKKKIKDLLESNDQLTPLNAFVSIIRKLRLSKEGLSESELNRALNITIEKIFIYDNKLAGVVNNAYGDYYGLWYFHNCNGTWESMGEDIGGETIFESEITFREKARIMLEKVNHKH
ncbi:MAG: peptidase E [Rikenellaceae bacterium]|nr:peptidase E [Rikenellaceae bacterium]